MAYWKYHIQSGDLLQFWYEAEDDDTTRLYWGTLRGIILPDDYDEDEVKSYDDIELSDRSRSTDMLLLELFYRVGELEKEADSDCG